MTADEWFRFWSENLIQDLAPNTLRNYRDRCKHNIQSKVLQELLGYSSIRTTMDRSVGVTDESLSRAVRQFEAGGRAGRKNGAEMVRKRERSGCCAEK